MKGGERKGKGLFIDKDLFLVKAERHSGSEQRGSGMLTSGLKIGRNLEWIVARVTMLDTYLN